MRVRQDTSSAPLASCCLALILLSVYCSAKTFRVRSELWRSGQCRDLESGGTARSPESSSIKISLTNPASSKVEPEIVPAPQVGTRLIAPLIALGAALQLLRYCNGRSLWLDESLLALNVAHRSLWGLFDPLDYHQGAPLGFLALQKLATTLVGHSELALRTVPLIAALLSLFLFVRVARLYLQDQAVPIAVALFALSPALIRYSSEAKQYSSDVAVTLLLLWAAGKFASSLPTKANILSFSLVGAIAIWFSHPATFVLAGIAVTLLIRAYLEHDREALRRTVLIGATWALSFGICYLVSLRHLRSDQALLDYWRNNLPTHPLLSLHNLRWIADSFLQMFSDPGQLTDFLGAAFFIAGCLALVQGNRRLCGLLLAPVAVTLLAAMVGRYPFGGRLLLFLLPLLALVTAQGLVWLASNTGRFRREVTIFLSTIVLLQPLLADAHELTHPRRPEDVKPAIRYILEHQHAGDTWFIYHWARYQFWYYSDLYDLHPADVRIGRDCGTDIVCYTTDLDQLRGKNRVWILFSHIWIGDGVEEEEVSVQHLDQIGKRLDKFSRPGVRAYLYDLSEPHPGTP
jgi:hypothetical protein